MQHQIWEVCTKNWDKRVRTRIEKGVILEEQGTVGLNYTYVPRSCARYPPDSPRNYGSGVSDDVFGAD